MGQVVKCGGQFAPIPYFPPVYSAGFWHPSIANHFIEFRDANANKSRRLNAV